MVASLLLPSCASGIVAFQSHNAEDYRDIINGSYRERPVTLHGKLVFPDGATGRVPAVVIVPGSGGVASWMDGYFAATLNRAGIATFRIDSFSNRGVVETATDQGRVSGPASALDGFNALRLLAAHPRIDAARIGITGFSRGGTVALYTAEERLARAVLPAGLRFAAHLAFYPGCATHWQNPRPTAAPILVLLGERDDYTGTDQCLASVERMRRQGARADVVVYPDAHHGWVSDASIRRIDVPTFRNCSFGIRDDGVIVDTKTGTVSRDGWRQGVRRALRTCAERGATYGTNRAIRERSLGDMVRFFRSAFGIE